VIAGFYIGYFRADLFDDAGAFMAQHGRQGMGVEPFDEMQIRMAKPGKCSVNEDFMSARLLCSDFLNDQRFIGFVQDCGFHEISPPAWANVQSRAYTPKCKRHNNCR